MKNIVWIVVGDHPDCYWKPLVYQGSRYLHEKSKAQFEFPTNAVHTSLAVR